MKILTKKAVLTCDHIGGKVNLKTTRKFVTINGDPIALAIDPSFKSIEGCPNASISIKPCKLTMPPGKGKSELVHIGGLPVALETIEGGTDGTPPGITKYGVRFAGQDFVNSDS